MTITKYDNYKESGIQWLEEIPKDWEVKRVKDLGEIRYGLGQPPRQKEGGLPIIRATNVERGKINENNMIFVDPDDIPYDRDPVLKEDDIIVVRSGAYTADSAIIPKKYAGAITGYDLVFRPKKIYPKYIAYSLLSNFLLKDQLIPLSLRAAQPHLNKDELGISVTVFPKYEEQTVIAHYLDAKTATIDAKIALLEQKISRYKELSKSLINETVCRGLDKNVKLKDSGIEWIGAIPEHWEVKRIKDVVANMSSGATPLTQVEGYYENGIVNWVNTGDLNDGVIEECKHKISQKAINDYPNLKLNRKGTLLVAMYGATIGKIGILNIEATTNQACCCINLKEKYFERFLFYWFLANKGHIISLNVGGTQPNISQGIISKLIMAIPNSKSEQTAIATYLDHQTGKLSAIVTNLGLQIGVLKELRKTLINDVVTGKVKVV
jgi:type I restriction enzyme, S subunit